MKKKKKERKKESLIGREGITGLSQTFSFHSGIGHGLLAARAGRKGGYDLALFVL